MIKSAFIGALFGTLAFHVLDALICKIHNSFFCEESFWENRQTPYIPAMTHAKPM